MNFSRQHEQPCKARQRFPEEATVSQISSKTMEITSQISISLGRRVAVRHPVRRGGLAWKVVLPWGNVENL